MTALTLSCSLTTTETEELRQVLADAVRELVPEGTPGITGAFEVTGAQGRGHAVIWLSGPRRAAAGVEGPWPIHLQLLYDPPRPPVTRLLSGGETLGVLVKLADLLAAAPAAPPADGEQWWLAALSAVRRAPRAR